MNSPKWRKKSPTGRKISYCCWPSWC